MKLLLNALKLAGENFPESFFIVDLLDQDQSILYVNKKFVEHSGYSKEEAIGKECCFLKGEETNPKTLSLINDAVNARKACYFNIVSYKKSGSKFWNRILLIPIGIREEDIRYYVGVQIDVTDQYEDFSREVPYQLLEETDTTLKGKINDIVNYYRSYKYLGMLEGQPEYREKLEQLADDTHKKIGEICEYLKSL